MYKEMKARLGQKGGIRNKKTMWELLADELNKKYSGLLTPLQVQNKWKSLERAYKRTLIKNKQSGEAATHCDFERELEEVLGKEHSIKPIVLYSAGKKISRNESGEMLPESVDEEPERTEPTDSEQSRSSSETRKAPRKDNSALAKLFAKMEELEEKRAERHREKMQLLERLVSACEKRQ